MISRGRGYSDHRIENFSPFSCYICATLSSGMVYSELEFCQILGTRWCELGNGFDVVDLDDGRMTSGSE